MNHHQQEVAERVGSYIIGGGGMTVGGVTWGGFVDFSNDLTTVFGMVAAFLGMVVVGYRLYRDIKRAKNDSL